jgi:hypothetical protein
MKFFQKYNVVLAMLLVVGVSLFSGYYTAQPTRRDVIDGVGWATFENSPLRRIGFSMLFLAIALFGILLMKSEFQRIRGEQNN